jgi:aryl-alcohol dehydrogenase-like predicted oxidoreductase
LALALDSYRLLGRSGLRVSPLALGTGTFGGTESWRSGENEARAVFARYLEDGGNFVDTADAYANGAAETLLGRLMRETGSRERLVVGTKFGADMRPGDPNAVGNGRKRIHAALDASLRRLQTDYVDVYWLHNWDRATPIEEVMSTLDSLVRAGKVHAVGLSNVPAWYAAKAQTLADERGWEPFSALQLPYSLVERGIELELVPAARELRVALVPWSPLASGFLTGKYTASDGGMQGEGRLSAHDSTSGQRVRSESQWRTLETLVGVAAGLGWTPAQVALSWVMDQPGVTSTVFGARNVDQYEQNLSRLGSSLPADAAAALEEAGRPAAIYPFARRNPRWAGSSEAFSF